MKNKKTPLQIPDMEEISKSLRILNDQQLHVYQVLYFNGLTDPRGNPLKVSRFINSNHVSILIEVARVGFENVGLFFKVRGNEGDDKILKMARMLMEAKGKILLPQACCEYAVATSCVCMYSYSCELHGERHIGTHD